MIHGILFQAELIVGSGSDLSLRPECIVKIDISHNSQSFHIGSLTHGEMDSVIGMPMWNLLEFFHSSNTVHQRHIPFL